MFTAANWQELSCSKLFSKGWDKPWSSPPNGGGGAPRQGWLNAYEGVNGKPIHSTGNFAVVTDGIFSTKIRTSSGEEVNAPNSLIGGSTTVNSSRLADGKGLVVHAIVTIGYNTPWRQVYAMPLAHALGTPPVTLQRLVIVSNCINKQ